ncbi:methyl farnesoate epoxidase isoform X2 [Bombus vancouverensis nearcticus]|uniref:methyl farnesoate epoxidase isoform X2 n=1 Tax=Bombus vancouverensis nearcticus TaxID=2705178 RepID=UPI00402BE55A
MLYVTISLLLILLFMFGVYDCIKPHNFPPGPKWLPVIGCFFTFRRLKLKHKYTYLALQDLRKTYGPILGLKLGNQKAVVISTYDLVKKVLLQEEFNGRPDGFFFRVRAFGKRKGILFTEGPMWSQCRRFTMRHLRTFGLGQAIMEQQLIVEADNLVNYLLRASVKGPVPMHTAFDIAVLNSLWFMFAGHRFDYANEKLVEILETVHDAFRLMDTMGGIVSQMPFLRFMIPELSGYNDLMRILQKLWNFLDEEINIHEKRLSGNQPQDLIDAFLLEISSKNTEQGDSIFDRENLLVLCLDLFLAGSKTTTDTLATTFLFLSLHSEWIKILQEELDIVVGRLRSPTLEDYSSLPLMESFLAEVQRYLILAPLGVPHKTMKDVTFSGYSIPKNTIILLDFHSVLNDPTYWDHPEEFRPQRFLDANGRFCQNNASIPFGLGKRRCPGEMLARTSLFLFFAYVIHYFDIEISPEHGKPDLNGYDGFTISPKSYYLKLTARSDVINCATIFTESIFQ